MVSNMQTFILKVLIFLLYRMVSNGGGVVGVTGATASLRGKPMTVGFAPGTTILSLYLRF